MQPRVAILSERSFLSVSKFNFQVHRFSRDLKHETKKPLLKVQIWDKDRLTRSDFIGKTALYVARCQIGQSGNISVCLCLYFA